MLKTYFLLLSKSACKSSWTAANGIEGAAIVGVITMWRGNISIISGSGPSIEAVNWALSFILYAAASFVLLFLIRIIFVSPFLIWKVEREARIAAETKVTLISRLPRPLAYVVTHLITESAGKDAIIIGFRLVVRNNGHDTLLWRVKHLNLSLDGTKLIDVGETKTWPVSGSYCSDLPIRFDTPLQVANGAKKVTAEIEVAYDNDPPLGIRSVWQKIEYAITWLDTQAPLFNTVDIVEHKER
jgi:hypothetical protein